MRRRLVSWNVHSFVGRDGRFDPERCARVLGRLEPDVVALQEVDWRLPDEPSDPLAFLARELGLVAVAGPNVLERRGAYGNALLTRMDVVRSRSVDLTRGRREPRGAIDALLEDRGGRLRCIVTHLGLRRRERIGQARHLATVLADGRREAPTALLGDLNEWRSRPLESLGDDVFPARSRTRTFPSRMPLLALDRALLWPAPRVFEEYAHADPPAPQASDHLPLVLDVEW